MNKIWLLLIIFVSMMNPVQAQTYQQLWEDVKQMEGKDLPRSVIEKATLVYDKAQKERNVPQMMKAYLTMMVYRGEIAPDSMASEMKVLEEWASDVQTSEPDKAVLYSILGGLTIGKDFEKGNEYLLLSLKDVEMLAGYPAGKWVPMVKVGETSRLYGDDNLYDLLARRAIALWRDNQWNSHRERVLERISKTYQSLFDLYQKENQRSAWLLTALDAFPDADEEQLREWIKEYDDLEVCAEVYLHLSYRLRTYERLEECLALVREGIKRYPRYERVNALKNVEKEILSPRLNLTVSSAYPDAPINVRAHYRNLKALMVQTYRLNLPFDAKELEDFDEKDLKKYGTWMHQEEVSLSPTTDYRMREEAIRFRPLPEGVYYLSIVGKEYPEVKEGVVLVVDDEMKIYRPLPDKKRETITMDKQSGTPIGEVVISSEKERWLRYHYSDNDPEQTHITIFTDRAIYRPGQTVYFSGLVYDQQGDSVRASEGKKWSIKLLDADGKERETRDEETDEFGSFNGTFVLPQDAQSGAWRIKVGQSMQTVRVEEYKRPTFEVTFDEVKEAYKAGDTLELTGKAITFAGTPVQNARVKYAVERMENAWWRRRGPVTHREEGETVTDEEGRFKVPVHFLPMKEGDAPYWYLTYGVSADVVSWAGETQSGNVSLPLGSSSLMVSVQPWKDILVKDHPESITLKVCNLMGEPVASEVNCEVMEGDRLVKSFVAESNRPWVPEALYQLPSGKYLLKVSVKDADGKANMQEYPFTLFSIEDTRVPYQTSEWSYQTASTFPATILYGSSEKNVTLFYDVFCGNKRLESRRIAFSDSLLRFPFEYKEEYGDGVLVSMAFVKDCQLHTSTFTIRKPQPEKDLKLKWTTFRDKLRPGEQETWTLSVLRPDGTPADVQLLASMYDASLDAFIPHAWNLNVWFNRSIPSTYWRAEGNDDTWLNLPYLLNPLKVNPLAYSELDVPSASRRAMAEMRMYKSLASVSGNALRQDVDIAFEEAVLGISTDVTNESETLDLSTDKPEIRSDFAETAFFYPCLRADENGEVKIEFTLPESLTTWKFMGLAHTKDMDYGQIASEVVAGKEFMLQAHMPRFVRVDDEVTLSATLVNLSDGDVIGNVRMELFNPATEKVYLTKKQRFLVTPKATTVVHFGFVVNGEWEDLAVRWVAEGDAFSDGEQHLLPVLTNRQWMVESVPFYVNGRGTSTFSLESLFNHHSSSVTRPRMTVEFTGNPGWYAVQALSALQEPQGEDAISWSASYYANKLVNYLAETHPEIAHRFDADSLGIRSSRALRQLKALQNEEGAWSWYQGMEGSRYMTTQVMELLTRLQVLTGRPLEEAEAMKLYAKGMAYLAKEAKKEYDAIRKFEKEGHKHWLPSEQVLHYLYICALNGSINTDEMGENRYFINRLTELENAGALTIYGKACSSIILQMAGKESKAREVLQSLMEYSVYTDEMGRYFDTPKALYSWKSYRIPTQVAAIEAISRIAKEEKTVEEMKRWLLQQKRTQNWESPVATTDAVYALLNTGNSVLDNTGAGKIKLGKVTVSLEESDTLAYVKQRVDGKVMNIREVTIRKESEGLGWGAVYAEYEEDMNRIGMQGNALSVRKQIYKDGKPVEEGTPLKVGDKLSIRLTISADRDMDFIEVKDERAACMEPVDVLSGYRWAEGIGYFQRTKDSSTSFYMDKMRKGTYELQYEVYVSHPGSYQEGAVTIRSVYAPEFTGHAGGRVLKVE